MCSTHYVSLLLLLHTHTRTYIYILLRSSSCVLRGEPLKSRPDRVVRFPSYRARVALTTVVSARITRIYPSRTVSAVYRRPSPVSTEITLAVRRNVAVVVFVVVIMDAVPVVAILTLLLFAAIVPASEGCDQTRQGCRIQEGQCLCGIGCYSEYRYSNNDECLKALKGRRYDFCGQGPCRHNGVCVQTSQDPGYKCRCSGTGYYGARCEIKCPGQNTSTKQEIPFECIVI